MANRPIYAATSTNDSNSSFSNSSNSTFHSTELIAGLANSCIELLETKVEEVKGRSHLLLQITQKTRAAIAMETVQETIIASASRFTLMPNLPNFVMGLFAHRNNIFWVLDLAQLLGFAALDSGAEDYHLVILQIPDQDKVIAVAVRRVLLVDRFVKEVISSPKEANLPPETVPFLQGCILSGDRTSNQNLDANRSLENIILILDGEAIAKTKFM